MNLTDLLRLLLSQVEFNQMEADGVRIDPQIRRGHQLHQIWESLSDDRERDAFSFYLDQEDRQALRAYHEWLEDEDDRGPELVSTVEGMLEKFVSHQGNISPKTRLFELLGFDTTWLSLEQYDQFSNIHKLLVCLAKMSAEISSNDTFDLNFFKRLDTYKLAFGFLHECIVQRKFVITEQQHSRLADFLSGHGIDLDDFFSNGGILIPGSPKFDEIFVRAMVNSSELSTITKFDEWSGRYIPLPVEWWMNLFRCWTIIHKRLSSEEHPVQDLLPFLKEVLPHLKQTKDFVFECELSDAMYGVLVELCKKLLKGSDAESPGDLDELLDFMIGQMVSRYFRRSSVLDDLDDHPDYSIFGIIESDGFSNYLRMDWRRLKLTSILELFPHYLLQVLLFISMLSPEQNKERNCEHPEYPDAHNFLVYRKYQRFLKECKVLMEAAFHEVNTLIHEKTNEDNYLLVLLCKISELVGIPPEVSVLKEEDTLISKIVGLLRHMMNISLRWKWSIAFRSLDAEKKVKFMKNYKFMYYFLRKVLSEPGYWLTEGEIDEVKSQLDPDFWNRIMSPTSSRFNHYWINDTAFFIPGFAESIFEQCQFSRDNRKRLLKIWKRTCMVLNSESSLSDKLRFLHDTFDIIYLTKKFINVEDQNESEIMRNLRSALENFSQRCLEDDGITQAQYSEQTLGETIHSDQIRFPEQLSDLAGFFQRSLM